ncbi:MAG: zinc-dependent metalloprotease, partial [Polyangiaceae bacterium]|nr:zinc-dependent metalloprotease [Polyangiaceae bacterium]
LHEWLRQQLHMSVIAHEMGHSMGLRHNFAGSFDALNYHTEYWQIRTRNGQEHYCGYPGRLDATTAHTDGTDCVGPRWVDPVTDQETSDLLWKWGSTTVMDYPGDPTQDTNDIGSYDKAAMRFGYADLADVEPTMSYRETSGGNVQGSNNAVDYLEALDGFGGIFGDSIGGNHYSTYADKYPVLGTCTARPGFSGDPSDPLSQQCSGPTLDYVAVRDMLTVDKISSAVTAVRPDLVANFAVDSGLPVWRQQHPEFKGRVRHPYMFGSDEFVDIGNVPVFRFDAGADSYEQMQFFISTYENRYVFNHFRRNNVLFNTDGVVSRVMDRYLDKIQAITKSLALGVEIDSPADLTDPGRLMPMALGAADGFSLFIRAMTRPAPGTYVETPTGTNGGPPNAWASAWQLGQNNQLTMPPSTVNVALGDGDGQYVHNDYDYTQGYWWADYQTQVGSYYEKVLAPAYLVEAYNQFVSNSEDDYVDGRYKNVSYATIYPNQIRRLFANLMATQSATQNLGSSAQIFTFAPYVMPASSGTGNPLTAVQYLPWTKYDTTSTDPTANQLTYPAGSVLLDPLVGWEQQYPALINLFWFGPTSLTMDLVDQMRIFSPGDAASVSLPADQQVRYRDPATGLEYVARNYGTESINPSIGFDVAKTVGARMLQYANTLAKTAYQVTAAPDPVTGELTYDTDASGNVIALPTAAAQAAATMLKAYSANIDVVRQLTLFFGYGPLGH